MHNKFIVNRVQIRITFTLNHNAPIQSPVLQGIVTSNQVERSRSRIPITFDEI